jgi:hypothetical protein
VSHLLNTRVGALTLLSKVSNFWNRTTIADGIFMSKLVYLILLSGGSSKGLLKCPPIIQNKAARAVTKLNWYTPTADLLRQCNWLSVHQLSVYHSVTLAFKVKQAKSPKYLFTMFNTSYNYKTRQADSGTRTPELELAKDIFSWRAAHMFKQLPEHIRNLNNLQAFKLAAKKWVRENIDVI